MLHELCSQDENIYLFVENHHFYFSKHFQSLEKYMYEQLGKDLSTVKLK